MSQYAYIPANKIDEVQETYTISPTNWQFEKEGVHYGGFEEIIFSPSQAEEIETLGGEIFENAQAFQNWMFNNPVLSQVKKDRAFGQELLNDYLAQNKSLELTTQQSLSQLSKFSTVKALLEVGAITASAQMISAIVVDEVFTQERKDYFISRINSYLSN